MRNAARGVTWVMPEGHQWRHIFSTPVLPPPGCPGSPEKEGVAGNGYIVMPLFLLLWESLTGKVPHMTCQIMKRPPPAPPPSGKPGSDVTTLFDVIALDDWSMRYTSGHCLGKCEGQWQEIPTLWNSLTLELQTASSLETWRTLKTFLFRQAFLVLAFELISSFHKLILYRCWCW